jgi:hypothetical protein
MIARAGVAAPLEATLLKAGTLVEVGVTVGAMGVAVARVEDWPEPEPEPEPEPDPDPDPDPEPEPEPEPEVEFPELGEDVESGGAVPLIEQ